MPVPDPRLGLFWGGFEFRGGAPDGRTSTGIAGAPALAPYTGLPSRPGPARSGQARSPTPQRASENLGRKSGPTTGSPTRAPTRAHGALRGLPLKAQDGPHRPGPARPGPTATREGRQKTPGREGPTSDRRGHSLRVAAPGGPRGPRGRGGGRKAPAGAGRPVRAAPPPGLAPRERRRYSPIYPEVQSSASAPAAGALTTAGRSRQRRRPSGTPPRTPRPNRIPCRRRRRSRGETLYKSGRQVAPDNRPKRQRGQLAISGT